MSRRLITIIAVVIIFISLTSFNLSAQTDLQTFSGFPSSIALPFGSGLNIGSISFSGAGFGSGAGLPPSFGGGQFPGALPSFSASINALTLPSFGNIPTIGTLPSLNTGAGIGSFSLPGNMLNTGTLSLGLQTLALPAALPGMGTLPIGGTTRFGSIQTPFSGSGLGSFSQFSLATGFGPTTGFGLSTYLPGFNFNTLPFWTKPATPKPPKPEPPEPGVPLERVSETAITIAKNYLESGGLEFDPTEDKGWENAQLGPMAYPIYNIAFGENDPAYLEFKVIGKDKGEDRGFILVSLTENDYPVVEFSTEGNTKSERIFEKSESSDVRIFRFDDIYMTAENNKGEKVTFYGPEPEPLRFPDSILNYVDQVFESGVTKEPGQAEAIDPNSTAPEDPDYLDAEPYESYEAFKEDYLNAEHFKLARKRRKAEAKPDWDIYLDREQTVIDVSKGVDTLILQDMIISRYSLEDPEMASVKIQDDGLLVNGKEPGGTILYVEDPSGVITYYILNITGSEFTAARSKGIKGGWSAWEYWYAGTWSDQRRYHQENCCGCVTGCGSVAWAMLYGWWDYKGLANTIPGTVAPQYLTYNDGTKYPNSDYIRDCILEVRNYMDSFCVAGQAATLPHKMSRGYKWARDFTTLGYSISTKYASPCVYVSSCRNRAKDSIQDNHRPAIIGIGCTASHYCLAYAYKYRKYTKWGTTWKRERYFKVNMGHKNNSPVWKKAKVWFGNKARFW